MHKKSRHVNHEERPTSDDNFYLFGRQVVREALLAGQSIDRILVSATAHGSAVSEIIRLAREKNILYQSVPPRSLDRISTGNHQGIIAQTALRPLLSLDELLQKSSSPGPLVILDHIEDPGNLGAILRSAAFFGAAGVVLPRWRTARITPAVMRTSSGAAAHIPIAGVANIAESIGALKERNFWVYGADPEGENLEKVTLQKPSALVVGAEGKGLSRLVKERCDALVSIPARGAVSSLNVSVATGIILYRLLQY